MKICLMIIMTSLLLFQTCKDEMRGKLEKYSNYDYNDIYAINYDKNIESDILVTTCPDAEGATSYSSELAEIASINLITGKITRLTKDLSKDSEPYWYPDKSKIFFTSKRPFKAYLAENGPDNIFYINRKNGLIVNFSDSLNKSFNKNLGMDISNPNWSKDKKMAFVTQEYDGDSFIETLKIFDESKNQLSTVDTSYFYGDIKWSCSGEYLYFESRDKDFESKNIIYSFLNNTKYIFDDTTKNYDFVDWNPNSNSPVFQVNDTLNNGINLYEFNSDRYTFTEKINIESINGKVELILGDFDKLLIQVEEPDYVYVLYIYDIDTNSKKKIYESKIMIQDISFIN